MEGANAQVNNSSNEGVQEVLLQMQAMTAAAT